MSSSTDSLKKKVCVTVFLDELFEEVLEDNWTDLKQVSEVTESEVKIAEEPFKGPPRIGLGTDEKVNVSPNADTERKQVHLRPRKHRRESKFSENLWDEFQGELTEPGHGSKFETYDEWCGSVESPDGDSDFELDDYLGGGLSKSSVSGLSESNSSAECFLSISTTPSSSPLSHAREETGTLPPPHAVTNNNRNVPSEETNLESELKSVQIEVKDENYLDKRGRNTGNDILAWKKTQKDIQLVLANAKGRQMGRENAEEKFEEPYNLRSILEACVKTEEEDGTKDTFFYADDNCSKMCVELKESLSKVFRDSNTKEIPNNNGREFASREVQRVCFKRSPWNDSFESEASEVETTKGIGLGPLSNESVLCYTLCLRCKKNVYPAPKCGESACCDATQSSTTNRESSLENLKSKTPQKPDLIFRTVNHLPNESILESILRTDQNRWGGEEGEKETGRSEGQLSIDSYGPLAIDVKSSIFGEGDTFSLDQTLSSDLEEKPKVNRTDSQMQDSDTCEHDILVSREELCANQKSKHIMKIESGVRGPRWRAVSPQRIAEILFKQHCNGNLEKTMTDAESEMIFAESENSYGNEDFKSSMESVVLSNPKNEIRVLEFEDQLSHSKMLRRMKTVEILGDNSLNDMNSRISTDVFLVCENVSSNEVSLEAWHSSASTMKSFTEMRQCYLKDSKDSTMYMVEIPLHFVRASQQQPPSEASCSD